MNKPMKINSEKIKSLEKTNTHTHKHTHIYTHLKTLKQTHRHKYTINGINTQIQISKDSHGNTDAHKFIKTPKKQESLLK